MSAVKNWIAEFSDELSRRGVAESRIAKEVDIVRQHIHSTGGTPESAFGDPINYAASITTEKGRDTPHGSVMFSIFMSIGSFIVFVIAGVRWMNGDAGAAPWAIFGGLSLLTASVIFSMLLTQRAVFTSLRDQPTRKTDTQWQRVSLTLLLSTPWVFIVFAGVVLAINAFI